MILTRVQGGRETERKRKKLGEHRERLWVRGFRKAGTGWNDQPADRKKRSLIRSKVRKFSEIQKKYLGDI